MNKARVLILAGDGINCENETALVLNHAGAQAEVCHVNDLLAQKRLDEKLKNYKAIVFPGGFSFGDHLGSGKVLASKVSHKLGEALVEFKRDQGGQILGICNGFQVLAQLGFFDHTFEDVGKVTCRLIENEHGCFINQWVEVLGESQSKVSYLKNFSSGDLPVRHAEGRVYFHCTQSEGISCEDLAKRYLELGQVGMRYKFDINGSAFQIAGLCSEDGKVFGLMPHPEAAYFSFQRRGVGGVVQEDDRSIGHQFWKEFIKTIDGECL